MTVFPRLDIPETIFPANRPCKDLSPRDKVVCPILTDRSLRYTSIYRCLGPDNKYLFQIFRRTTCAGPPEHRNTSSSGAYGRSPGEVLSLQYLQCSHNEILDHLIYTGIVLPFHLCQARLDPKSQLKTKPKTLLAWAYVSNPSYRALLDLGRPKIGTRLMKAARVEPHVGLGTINNNSQYS